LGCPGVLASASPEPEQDAQGTDHKFERTTQFSYERLFDFAFRSWFISYMRELEHQIGSEDFLDLLRHAGDNHYRSGVKSRFAKIESRSVQSLIEVFWEPIMRSEFGGSIMTAEVVEKSPMAGAVRIKECLFAKTFRDNNAGDLGYAAICHADFAVTDEFNPKIQLTRNTCLMNGDGSCLFEYAMKS
jgi:hypothetical protein